MLTQEDLQAIGALIRDEGNRLDHKIEAEVARLDQKIEAGFAFSQKAHAEIMEHLVESNEINEESDKVVKERIKWLEEHAKATKTT